MKKFLLSLAVLAMTSVVVTACGQKAAEEPAATDESSTPAVIEESAVTPSVDAAVVETPAK